MRNDMMSIVLASAIMSSGAGRVLVVDADRRGRRDEIDLLARDEMDIMERLNILEAMLPYDDRPRDSMGFRHPHPTLPASITFVDTPKPISKRKARRLRGRGSMTHTQSLEGLRSHGFPPVMLASDGAKTGNRS